MRISDWSSDVCSSDLVFKSGETITGTGFEIWLYRKLRVRIIAIFHGSDSRPPFLAPNVSKLSAKEMLNRTLLTRARTDRVSASADVIVRSEERRVGKEGVSTGSSRWSPVN